MTLQRPTINNRALSTYLNEQLRGSSIPVLCIRVRVRDTFDLWSSVLGKNRKSISIKRFAFTPLSMTMFESATKIIFVDGQIELNIDGESRHTQNGNSRANKSILSL